MASGGARTRSGPAPDPLAFKRERDVGEWTVLPAEGRAEEAPVFPLLYPSEREIDLWLGLWSKPQAIMWERYGQELEVALYVRSIARAEAEDSPVNLGTLVRQMADSLGLTTPGMRANRWKIQREEPVRKADEPPAKPLPAVDSSRDRFKVVRGGKAS